MNTSPLEQIIHLLENSLPALGQELSREAFLYNNHLLPTTPIAISNACFIPKKQAEVSAQVGSQGVAKIQTLPASPSPLTLSPTEKLITEKKLPSSLLSPPLSTPLPLPEKNRDLEKSKEKSTERTWENIPEKTIQKNPGKKFYLQSSPLSIPPCDLEPVAAYLKHLRNNSNLAHLAWIDKTPSKSTLQNRSELLSPPSDSPPAHILIMIPLPQDLSLLATVERFVQAIFSTLISLCPVAPPRVLWIKKEWNELSHDMHSQILGGIEEKITHLLITSEEIIQLLSNQIDSSVSSPLPKKIHSCHCLPFFCDNSLHNAEKKQRLWQELLPILQLVSKQIMGK